MQALSTYLRREKKEDILTETETCHLSKFNLIFQLIRCFIIFFLLFLGYIIFSAVFRGLMKKIISWRCSFFLLFFLLVLSFLENHRKRYFLLLLFAIESIGKTSHLPMEFHGDVRQHGGCLKFFSDFRALFVRTFLLTIRKPGQTIAEILLAYTFMGFLLGMRYIMDRRFSADYSITRFSAQYGYLNYGFIGNTTYYYPSLFIELFFSFVRSIIFR